MDWAAPRDVQAHMESSTLNATTAPGLSLAAAHQIVADHESRTIIDTDFEEETRLREALDRIAEAFRTRRATPERSRVRAYTEVTAPPPQASTITAFGMSWGYSRRQVFNFLDLGLPSVGRGRGRRILIHEGNVWMREYLGGSDDAKDNSLRIDLCVGPRKIDLILTLHERHDPLLLDERGVRIVELDFHPLADRQGNQFHAGQGCIGAGKQPGEGAASKGSGKQQLLERQRLAHN